MTALLNRLFAADTFERRRLTCGACGYTGTGFQRYTVGVYDNDVVGQHKHERLDCPRCRTDANGTRLDPRDYPPKRLGVKVK